MNSENIVIITLGDNSKEQLLEYFENIFKEQGDFGVYGDIREGLSELSKEHKLKFTEKDLFWSVEIFPVSNSGGHDFTFRIDKKENKIFDLVIGEILPDEEEPE